MIETVVTPPGVTAPAVPSLILVVVVVVAAVFFKPIRYPVGPRGTNDVPLKYVAGTALSETLTGVPILPVMGAVTVMATPLESPIWFHVPTPSPSMSR